MCECCSGDCRICAPENELPGLPPKVYAIDGEEPVRPYEGNIIDAEKNQRLFEDLLLRTMIENPDLFIKMLEQYKEKFTENKRGQ